MHMDCILYHSLSLPLSFLPIEATTTTVAIHATGQRMTPRGRTALSVERFQNFLKTISSKKIRFGRRRVGSPYSCYQIFCLKKNSLRIPKQNPFCLFRSFFLHICLSDCLISLSYTWMILSYSWPWLFLHLDLFVTVSLLNLDIST